ncbi:MAG TPA: type II secretion system protein, partial [Acidimicrobiia bacterium]|nr:type II secretion system protein [Acidimicrobiia bacterium]
MTARRGTLGHRRLHAGDRRAVVGCEGGFTILELVVALSLLAVVAVGFAASVGLGFRGIAIARQRQSAVQIASARLEEARYDNYSQLALPNTLSHSTDPANPDYFVSNDGSTFDVSGTGQFEPLVYSASGVANHFQDPVQVGAVLMQVYEYVTWVNDASAGGANAYKRVTIVVVYKTPVSTGISRMVRLSSFFTPDAVTFPTTTTVATPTTTVATTTTTVPTGTTTTAPGSCSGTPVGGAFAIGTPSGSVSGFTPSTNVTLNVTVTGSCTPIQARFSNDGTTWGAWIATSGGTQQISWSIPAGDGNKTVYGQVQDSSGGTAGMANQSIVLDATPPTTPGGLTYSASCSGNNRTV